MVFPIGWPQSTANGLHITHFAFGWTCQNNGANVPIDSQCQNIDIADNLIFARSKLQANIFPLRGKGLTINVSRRNTSLEKLLLDMLGMYSVDSKNQSGTANGMLEPYSDDVG